MKLPILLWLLQGIPESLGLISLALAGIKLKIRQIALLGIIEAVIILVIRLLPLSFGVHSILSIFSIAILLKMFNKARFSKGLLVALLVVITLAAAEAAFFTLFLSLFDLSFEQLSENIFFLVVSGWPQVLLLFILALVINRWHCLRHAPGEEV